MKFPTPLLVHYGVTVVKAIAIGVLGWVLAVIGGKIVKRLLGQIEGLRKQGNLPENAGRLVYYFILLATIVAVLETVGLRYVTEPFIDFLNKIVNYLPNAIGAGVILLIGTFLAKIAKEFVSSFFETFRIEEFSKKYGIENLGEAVGNLTYLLIIIFIAIAALNALQIEAITKPAVSMLTVILNAIPKILAAAVIFGIIFFVGKIIAQIVSNLVVELNLNELAKEIGISSNKLKFNNLVKYIVLSFATLLGLAQAFNYLQAKALYELTYSFIVIAFKIIIAGIILFGGTYIGNLFERKTENQAIGRTIKYSLIGASIFIVLPYVGVSPKIVEIVVLSISLGIGLAFALAFGLGGKEVAKELLEKFLSEEKKNTP